MTFKLRNIKEKTMSFSQFQMVKRSIALTLALIVSGCIQAPTIFQPFAARDINDKFESGFYVPSTDTLYIVFDSSASMNLPYLEGKYQGIPLPPRAPSRFQVGQEIIKRMTHTLPAMDLNIAVRTFGYGSCLSWENTQLSYPLQPFTLKDFKAAYDSLECASGGSPLDQALLGVNSDLQNSQSNNITLVIISDGEDYDDDPMPALETLKNTFGQRLCLDTIWLGETDENEQPGKQTLQQLTDAIGCGQTYEAKNVASPSDMAVFVRNVFMTAVDMDEDGVPDVKDDCPGSVLVGQSATGQKVTGFNACSN
ncbi:MAG: hypothetical protein ACU826_00380 [Gammaproteobacteria bacterium]